MHLSLGLGRTSRSAAVLVVAAAALASVGAVTNAGGATPRSGLPVAAVKASVDPALRGLTGTTRVIVQGARSSEAGVTQLGGRITGELPIIGGYTAAVPARSVAQIAALPGVRAITKDGKVHIQAIPGSATTGTDAPADVYQQVIGADALQSQGDSGNGVTVALIDTGVSPLSDVADRLVPVRTSLLGNQTAPCLNLSGDATCDDEYGHGTFMAGLIAGTGAASGGQYSGVAPGAKILSIKIAGADGSADISKVIAALQWVTAMHNVYGIKVLNLSLGSNSDQSYLLSPLDNAVEQAWRAGVTVVVSAANLGPDPQTIDKPADDPFVITVGAVDDNGTVDTSDDSVPDFSSRGPTAADGLAKPDVAAPGANLISLAAPGATITTQYPPAMAAPYRQGSGTSMSAAVTSGLVADVLSAHPSWSPDRVKFALASTATPEASTDPMAVGSGVVNGAAALTAPAGLANQGVRPSKGLGSLAIDRGSAQGSTWYGSTWYGSTWYGSTWYGSTWYGSTWYGSTWYGSTWYGAWK